MDASEANVSKYKGMFTNGSTKKDFVTVSPFKIVPGLSSEMMKSRGMVTPSYPTPRNSSKSR